MTIEQLLLLLDERYPNVFPSTIKSYDEYLVKKGQREVVNHINELLQTIERRSKRCVRVIAVIRDMSVDF